MDYVHSVVLILSVQLTFVDSKPHDKPPCIEGSTRSYNGKLNVTLSGFGCQAWSSQTPHEHTRNLPSMFPADASVEDAKNYCRDTEDEGRLWCYTLNPARRWEYCNIEPCNSEDQVQTNVNVLRCQVISGKLADVNCPLIFCATSINMVPLVSYTGDVSLCSYVCCTTDDFTGSTTEMSLSTVTWVTASIEPAKPTTASSALTLITEGITDVTLDGDQFVMKSVNPFVEAEKTTPSSASMFITESITDSISDAEQDVTKSSDSFAATMSPVISVSTLITGGSTVYTSDAKETVAKSVNDKNDMLTVPTISNDLVIEINESNFPKQPTEPPQVSATFPTFSFTSQTSEYIMSWSTTFPLFSLSLISPVSNRPTPPLQTFILTPSPVSSPPSSKSEVTIQSFTNTTDNDVSTNDTDEEFSAINTNRAADDKDIGISANDTVKDSSANDTDKDISANDTDKDISANYTDKAISKNDTNKDISANDTDKDISANDTDKDISANDTYNAISANDTDKAISDHNIGTSISTNDTDKGLSTKYTDIFSNDTVNDGQESTNSTDFDGLISSTETLHLALLEDLSLSISYLAIFTFYLLKLCNVLVFP